MGIALFVSAASSGGSGGNSGGSGNNSCGSISVGAMPTPYFTAPPAVATTAAPMCSFLNTLGINLHGGGWANYGNPSLYLPYLYAGGWRHVRTNISTDATTISQIQQVAAHGISIALTSDGCLGAFGGYTNGIWGNLTSAAQRCVTWIVSNNLQNDITELLGPN